MIQADNYLCRNWTGISASTCRRKQEGCQTWLKFDKSLFWCEKKQQGENISHCIFFIV